MAGPGTIQSLDTRECQCEQNVTFYVVLGATIVIAILNLVAGIAFCVWRKRRTQQRGWADEKARRSLAGLAHPRPNVYFDDLTSPRTRTHHQAASEHVRVMVDVSEHTDARSEHGSPPRRRSGTALLAKVLGAGGDKRRSGGTVSSKLSLPKSPVSSMREKFSPLTSKPPPLPISFAPAAATRSQQQLVAPKPRYASLTGSGPATAPAELLSPPVPPPKPVASSQFVSGSSVAHEENDKKSKMEHTLAVIPASPPPPSGTPSPPNGNRPPPLPIDRPTRNSHMSIAGASHISPITPSTAPSSMFTGSNAPRALSYVWPRSTRPGQTPSETEPGLSAQIRWKAPQLMASAQAAPVSAPVTGPALSQLAAESMADVARQRHRNSEIKPPPTKRPVPVPRPMPSIPPSPKANAPAPPSPVALAPPAPLQVTKRPIGVRTAREEVVSSAPPILPPLSHLRNVDTHQPSNPGWMYPNSTSEAQQSVINTTAKNDISPPSDKGHALPRPSAGRRYGVPRQEQTFVVPAPSDWNRQHRPLPRAPDVPRKVGDSISTNLTSS